MKITIWAATAFLTLAAPAWAEDSPRVRQTIDFGWKFSKGTVSGAEAIGFNDAQWSSVDLPHDWSIYGPFDTANNPRSEAALPTGMGWYSKVMAVPAEYRGKRVCLEFDGIYQNGEVFVNGHSVGKRPYGYSSVCYDVTQFVNFGGDNTLAVKVDNTQQPNSRWYPGSGIYRHTWLIATDALHIPQWGTYVTTPQVSADSATVNVQVQLANQRSAAAPFELLSTVLDKDGAVAGTATSTTQLDAGAKGAVTQQIQVNQPSLWSIDHPTMYTLRTQVRAGGAVVDQYDTPIGIRTLVYDVDKGLLINGDHVKLNGVCLHADGGSVGVAVPEGVWLRRLTALKEMGCNSIRCSHNPPDPDFLDLCDQVGITVMDELYDEWIDAKTAQSSHLFFNEWWVRDTTDFVRRDRNHPSVVMWSAGNEIHNEQTSPNGWQVLKGPVDIFHKEDPTRPVTSGCDNLHAQPRSTTLEFLAQLDVAGYNYPGRWAQYGYLYFEPDRLAFPTRKFIGTEDGSMGGGLRGSYGNAFVASAAPASQPAATGGGRGIGFGGGRGGGGPNLSVENLWKNVRIHDYVIGDYMWTGIDYLGEGVPGASSGVLDRCGFKKDGYYFYQSQWTAKPMVHIFPHWNWPGHEGQTITVYAYTNCDSVQLFVNDKAYAAKGYRFPTPGQGTLPGAAPAAGGRGRGVVGRGGGGGVQMTGDLHLSWDVTYEPGTIRAVGTSGGAIVVTDEIATTDVPAALDMHVDKTTAAADGRDVVHVEIRVVDGKGRMVPGANNLVQFGVQGAAKIIGVDNGSNSIDEGFKSDRRTALNGMCLAILQTTQKGGSIHVTAHADGLRDASADITSR